MADDRLTRSGRLASRARRIAHVDGSGRLVGHVDVDVVEGQVACGVVDGAREARLGLALRRAIDHLALQSLAGRARVAEGREAIARTAAAPVGRSVGCRGVAAGESCAVVGAAATRDEPKRSACDDEDGSPPRCSRPCHRPLSSHVVRNCLRAQSAGGVPCLSVDERVQHKPCWACCTGNNSPLRGNTWPLVWSLYSLSPRRIELERGSSVGGSRRARLRLGAGHYERIATGPRDDGCGLLARCLGMRHDGKMDAESGLEGADGRRQRRASEHHVDRERTRCAGSGQHRRQVDGVAVRTEKRLGDRYVARAAADPCAHHRRQGSCREYREQGAAFRREERQRVARELHPNRLSRCSHGRSRRFDPCCAHWNHSAFRRR